MSNFIIEDGTGDGYKLEITPNNEAKVLATVYDRAANNSEQYGTTFNVDSDFISYTTTSSYSGLLYIQNDDPGKILHIDAFRVSSTATCLFRNIKNPTTGTLVSGGSAITPQALNFSSTQTALATCKKGADGLTITNGTLVGSGAVPAYATTSIDLRSTVVLAYGDTVAVEVKPTGSASIAISARIFYEMEHD